MYPHQRVQLLLDIDQSVGRSVGWTTYATRTNYLCRDDPLGHTHIQSIPVKRIVVPGVSPFCSTCLTAVAADVHVVERCGVVDVVELMWCGGVDVVEWM